MGDFKERWNNLDEKSKKEIFTGLKSIPGLIIGGFFFILFTNQLGSIFNVELLDTMENWIANSSTFMKIIVFGFVGAISWIYWYDKQFIYLQSSLRKSIGDG